MDITVFQTAQVSRQTINNNGFEFSYKALTQRKRTKKVHPFDKICIQNKIQHRTIKFRHPWTNGMVERFNRTLMGKVLDRQIVL